MTLHSTSRELTACAFTRAELLVVCAVIGMLVALLAPMLANAKRRAQRITCIGHLKNIGLGYRIWATGHTNSFPMNLSTNLGGTHELLAGSETFRHFQALPNELNTPLILVCPSDTRKPAANFARLKNENISYFVGLDADETAPQTLLAGDRNLTINGVAVENGIVEVTGKTVVGWTATMHRGVGNVAVGDGSVQQATTLRLRDQMRNLGMVTNRLSFP